MQSDAAPTMPPALSSDAELPAASLSSRPSWQDYLGAVDHAADYLNAVRTKEGVFDLFPKAASIPNFGE